MPVSFYDTLVNQAVNIGSMLSGRKFEFSTQEDDDAAFLAQVEELRKKGLIPEKPKEDGE